MSTERTPEQSLESQMALIPTMDLRVAEFTPAQEPTTAHRDLSALRLATMGALSAFAFAVPAVAQAPAEGAEYDPAQAAAAMEQYKAMCKAQGTRGIAGVIARYRSNSRRKLDIDASTSSLQTCDNDSGDAVDVGDREYYTSREVYRSGAWKRSGSETNLDEERTNLLGRVDSTITTATCKKGTRYRGVVKVKWTPHDGTSPTTRKYPSKSKTC